MLRKRVTLVRVLLWWSNVGSLLYLHSLLHQGFFLLLFSLGFPGLGSYRNQREREPAPGCTSSKCSMSRAGDLPHKDSACPRAGVELVICYRSSKFSSGNDWRTRRNSLMGYLFFFSSFTFGWGPLFSGKTKTTLPWPTPGSRVSRVSSGWYFPELWNTKDYSTDSVDFWVSTLPWMGDSSKALQSTDKHGPSKVEQCGGDFFDGIGWYPQGVTYILRTYLFSFDSSLLGIQTTTSSMDVVRRSGICYGFLTKWGCPCLNINPKYACLTIPFTTYQYSRPTVFDDYTPELEGRRSRPGTLDCNLTN